MDTTEIYEALAVADAPDAVKRRILGNILVVVEQRFAVLADELLSDSQQEAFEEVAAHQDVTAVNQWLEANVPHARELYTAILRDHVAELAGRLQ